MAASRVARMVLILFGAALSLSAPSLTSPASAKPAATSPISLGSGLTPDAVDQVAAAQLAIDRHVSSSEALNEILLQDALDPYAAKAATALGPSWTGASYDVGNGGALVLYGTDIAALNAFVASLPTQVQPSVKSRGVRYSLKDLRVAQASLDAAMMMSQSPGSTVLQPDLDRVEARLPPPSTLSSTSVPSDPATVATALQQNPTVSNALSKLGDAAVASVSAPVLDAGACYGSYMLCDNPLRGGNAIQNERTGAGENCTTGFYVRSIYAPYLPYEMTAGHCALNGDQWDTIMPKDGAWHHLGSTIEQHDQTNSSTVDAELVSIDNPLGWTPSNIVRVEPSYGSSGNQVSSENQQYPVTQVGWSADIPPSDTYLCHTGAGINGTACGAFVGSATAAGTANLGVIDMTSTGLGSAYLGCQGDSGGPIFRRNEAYGLLKAIRLDIHISNLFDGLSYASPWCGDEIYYMGMGLALSATHTNLVTSPYG